MSPSQSPSKPNRVAIHLHINDLRTHDSPILHHVHQTNAGKEISHFLPIFVFDERVVCLGGVPGYGKQGGEGEVLVEVNGLSGRGAAATSDGDKPKELGTSSVPEPRTRQSKFWKTGRHRARFLVESVFDLKEQYKKKGGDLVLACGRTEEVLEEVVRGLIGKEGAEGEGYEVKEVWMQKEVTTEEVTLIRRLRSRLKQYDVAVKLVDSKPMVQPEDLPFPIDQIPDVYTSFRKQVEGVGNDMIRQPLPDTNKVKPLPKVPSNLKETVYLLPSELRSTKAFLPHILAPLLAKPDIGDPLKPIPMPTSEEEWKSYSSKIPDLDSRSAFPFHGGESTALARLDDYLGTLGKGDNNDGQGGEKAMSYKDTRNELLGEGFSTKFSGWLANGTMSGRYAGWRVWQLLERLQDEKKLNKHVEGNVYWIQFELLWRDYFYYVSQKFSHLPSYSSERSRKKRGISEYHPDAGEAGTASTLFNLGGFEEVLKPKNSEKTINEWKTCDLEKKDDKARIFLEGQSGVPFVDAAMRELAASGYMSNRMRQNVASFFAVDLYIDWRVAAEWFESYLIDHDVCSNWGNWQYQAGVGNDPRASRKFNQIKQANDYDKEDRYVKTWVPELKDLPEQFVQTPWVMPDGDKKKYGIGEKYPAQPMVEAQEWKKHYRSGRGGHGGGHGGGGQGGGRGGGHGGNHRGRGKGKHS